MDYISLATLKTALKITDNDRDALLASAITAASRHIDQLTGVPAPGFGADPVTTTRVFNPWQRIVYHPGGDLLLVDAISSLTGLVVEVGAGVSYTTVDPTTYETQPDNAPALDEPTNALLRTGGIWAAGQLSRIRITARWGWPAVPAEITQAALIQATRLFKRKDSPEGVLGSADWGTVRLTGVDPDVKALISRYLLPGFA